MTPELKELRARLKFFSTIARLAKIAEWRLGKAYRAFDASI